MIKEMVLSSSLILGIIKMDTNAEIIDTNVFIDTTHDLKIRKPASWHFATPEEINIGIDSIEIKNKEVKKQIRNNDNYRIVNIRKFKEPYDGVNPSIGIIIKPLTNYWNRLNNIDLIKGTILTAKKISPDLVILKDIKKINVRKYKAATVTVQYTYEMKNGKKYIMQSKLILFKKGKDLCRIGISLPQNPSQEDIEATEAIIKTLEMQ